MGTGNVLSALEHLKASELSYSDWISVGMALKHEGYDCGVWEEWSRGDSRWHKGECERKWKSFLGSSSPVTGATIFMMAKERGWEPNGGLDWNDIDSSVSAKNSSLQSSFSETCCGRPVDPKTSFRPVRLLYDGDVSKTGKSAPALAPAEELILYLRTVFKDDEYVSYVAQSFQDEDGRWKPGGAGCCDRTAGELIAELERHPDDIGAVLGDTKPDAGAWIRFNPVDRKGARNDNVTSFRHALVESDSMSIPEQEAAYRKLQLPIACLVYSGGKSLHAIVRVDASSYEEYRERVDYLYTKLASAGLEIDRQNKNPSRLSRMPGIMRGGERQRLVAVNIGKKDWSGWVDFMENGLADDGLPDFDVWSEVEEDLPDLLPELIHGVLRQGHKMLISGSSKAGKSFLLMELCVAISEGKEWLGFQCEQGKVLYINFEIDRASCLHRIEAIFRALGVRAEHKGDLVTWNLRGNAEPLDRLVPKLIRRVKGKGFAAIVVDPIYKVITGDENNASEMGAFCNQFDRICSETSCSVICCHHHSKGAQGAKRAMDRASGSGVFARDPDAQLDMIQLELTPEQQLRLQDGNATAWRMESSLREFANFRPVNFWFEYPLHRVDKSGELAKASAEGSPVGKAAGSGRRGPAARRERLDAAFSDCDLDGAGKVRVAELAEFLQVSNETVRHYIAENPDEYRCVHGMAVRREGG